MKKIIFLISFVLMLSSVSFADMNKQEASSIFDRANTAYQQGNYTEAIDQYESILAGGLESGPVYYNLGNSYFRKGRAGKAILNYERARELTPRDRDLNFNYKHAKKQILSEAGSSGFIQKLVASHTSFYSISEMVVCVTTLFLLAGALILFSLYLKWPMRLVINIGIVLDILLIIHIGGLVIKSQDMNNAAIILETTAAKFEPREDSTTHYKLEEGAKAKIVKTEGDWVKIKRPDGKLGWVFKQALEPI